VYGGCRTTFQNVRYPASKVHRLRASGGNFTSQTKKENIYNLILSPLPIFNLRLVVPKSECLSACVSHQFVACIRPLIHRLPCITDTSSGDIYQTLKLLILILSTAAITLYRKLPAQKEQNTVLPILLQKLHL